MLSKLTFKSYLFPTVSVVLIIVSSYVIINNYPINFSQLRWIDYFITILILITLVWLFKLEIIPKMIFIEVKGKSITLRNILFSKRTLEFDDLKGYKTRIIKQGLGYIEETVISTNGKGELILSEFFLKNYKELKSELTKNLKYNGGGSKYNP